jgi:hypothetical protein
MEYKTIPQNKQEMEFSPRTEKELNLHDSITMLVHPL